MNIPSSSIISKTVIINAPTSQVWEALTNPSLMQKWMFEKEIIFITDWQIGGPIITRGDLHGIHFENNGLVLQFEPEKVLRYSHLSSISRLPDKPESYAI